MKHQNIDWSVPQRQPLAGLLIAFWQVLWEVIKRSWWIFLVVLLKDKPDESSRINRYEIIALLIGVLTFTGTLLQYFYFRFYILHNELIIKKGWIKKQTLVVPLQKIQTVHIEASLLHQVLNVVKLSVNTAGSDKTEIEIDALGKPMAEALRQQLETDIRVEEALVNKENRKPILRLSATDLLKLSLSANHLETFVLLLSFGVGLYDNLKDIDKTFLPNATNIGFSGMMLLFLVTAILLTTILISTIRIFLRFYGLTVFENSGGLSLRSGLTNVKEQAVSAGKVQAITWKANWIRHRLGLWLLEFRIAGNDELKKKQKVLVPVTQSLDLPVLVNTYYPVPNIMGAHSLRIHPSYVWRKLLLSGLLPSVLLAAISFWWWGTNSLFFFFIALFVGIGAARHQKQFQLWAFTEVAYIDKSTWGLEKVLLQWYKIQSVQVKQSLFQRKKGLATVTFYTACGRFTVPYIAETEARILANYTLYKIESSTQKWM